MTRFLCVVDFPVRQGERWLWDYLPGNTDVVDFVVTQPRDLLGGVGKVLTRYPGYALSADAALNRAKMHKYDAIVAWESKNGLPLACLRWLRHDSNVPLVMLTMSAKKTTLNMGVLVGRWLKYVDHITVPSAWEASFYSRKLGLPQSKFSVCHLGAYDRRSATSSERAPEVEPPETRYLFSGGRTDRDYATLLSAVAGTGIKTHVNTRPYIVRGLNIPNEVSLNDLMSGEEYVDAVTHASIVVVPLKAVDHAAGLSLILDAMMFGRPVICSDVPAAREYVIDSTTGILVPPGDVDALRKTIRSLASDPALCDHLGRAARTLYEERFTFAAFAQRSCEIIARATGVSSRLQPHQEPGP